MEKDGDGWMGCDGMELQMDGETIGRGAQSNQIKSNQSRTEREADHLRHARECQSSADAAAAVTSLQGIDCDHPWKGLPGVCVKYRWLLYLGTYRAILVSTGNSCVHLIVQCVLVGALSTQPAWAVGVELRQTDGGRRQLEEESGFSPLHTPNLR